VSASKPTGGDEKSTSQILAQLRAGSKLNGAASPKACRPVEATLKVLEVIDETPDVRTFRLDNSAVLVPFQFPGQFAKVCVPVDGSDVWRSFTISSSPATKEHLDLTIKLNPAGTVSRYLFENVQPGSSIKLKGAQGGFYFDVSRHPEPLVLVSAGSGITPMMSIVRSLVATGSTLACTFLYGARTPADIIFHEECLQLAAANPWLRYVVSLSQPGDSWSGECGRIDFERLSLLVDDLMACRYFLCGPNEFMEELQSALRDAGVPADRIHTEQFHQTKMPATAC
jgi:ferredoxin-NADP reductase